MALLIFAGLYETGSLRSVLRVGTVAGKMEDGSDQRRNRIVEPKKRTHICSDVSLHSGSRVDLRSCIGSLIAGKDV